MSTIKIDKNALISSLVELEFIIVSLDRIGSAGLSSEDMESVLYRFVVEGDIFRRLAGVRRQLMSCVDGSLSPSEREEIESSLDAISPWSYK